MCELLGMDCNVPTDILFSFTGLAMRGGRTAPHSDGWGLALYEGRFARTFLEPLPACDSALARFLSFNPIRTLIAIAHVRRRTRGAQAIENTHPFKRVFWGRHWTFAHNGTLPAVKERRLADFTPLGETDSEHAFCWMLGELRAAFPDGYPEDRLPELWRTIAELTGVLGAEGSFNVLLSDGRHLFARCGTKLCHLIRSAPFGRATLRDADVQVDFSATAGQHDRVAIVATEPLTCDETWTPGRPGTMWVFEDGLLRTTLASRDPSGRDEWAGPPDFPDEAIAR